MEDKEKETSPKEAQNVRSACTECQRRKQKCNREWPCNHCQKRKVADQCRFKDISTTAKSPPEIANQKKKREREEEPVDDAEPTQEDGDVDLAQLGYAQGHFITAMKSPAEKTERKVPEQTYKELKDCPQLRNAVEALPPRPYTDSLVENFLKSVNFHYYLIYPNSFLTEYQAWWSDRSASRPLGLQWTCLLLQICACSAQYIHEDLQRKFQTDLGCSSQTLTEKYHNAAKELQSVIPVGTPHLYNVQTLLHSCYWYKSEAQFVECWHILNLAVREAQELGIDKEGVVGDIPEFEREMHRRVWTVLDTWDWQISALLSRPMIIDRTGIDVGLPSLTLEGYDVSPLLHMRMQSELITKLSKKYGLPKNVTTPDEVQEYQSDLEEWMASFPPTYRFDNPDKSKDAMLPWCELQRHYLHTMSCSMMLDPIRAYLAKPMNRKTTPEKELQIRKDGIDYALKIMNSLYGFFDYVWPRDAKFHFVIFSIFDTAAVYSSVIMHDEDNSAPKRPEMLKAMEAALGMIKKLAGPVPAAGMYHNILTRLYKKTLRKINGVGKRLDAPRKKARVQSMVRKLEEKEQAQLSEASASSNENLAVDQESTSPGSSGNRSAPKTEPEPLHTQQPLVYPQPPPIHENTLHPPQQTYDFDPSPFLNDTYPIQDPTLYNGAACLLDGGGGLPPPPPGGLPGELHSFGHNGFPDAGGSFGTNGEFVPNMEPMPDMNWQPMSMEELGPLGELWRWESLDLGLVQNADLGAVNMAQLDIANGQPQGASLYDGTSDPNGTHEQKNGYEAGVNRHVNNHAGNGQSF